LSFAPEQTKHLMFRMQAVQPSATALECTGVSFFLPPHTPQPSPAELQAAAQAATQAVTQTAALATKKPVVEHPLFPSASSAAAASEAPAAEPASPLPPLPEPALSPSQQLQPLLPAARCLQLNCKVGFLDQPLAVQEAAASAPAAGAAKEAEATAAGAYDLRPADASPCSSPAPSPADVRSQFLAAYVSCLSQRPSPPQASAGAGPGAGRRLAAVERALLHTLPCAALAVLSPRPSCFITVNRAAPALVNEFLQVRTHARTALVAKVLAQPRRTQHGHA
jgi:hypothetical protein